MPLRISRKTRSPEASATSVKKAKSSSAAAPAFSACREALGQRADRSRARRVAALGGQARHLAQHERARLEQVAQHGRPQVGQDVERAVRAPVAHARGVPVARLDHPDLLQALERLAQRLQRHPQVRGQLALARQLLTRHVAAGHDRLEEVDEDALGGVLNSRHAGGSLPEFRTLGGFEVLVGGWAEQARGGGGGGGARSGGASRLGSSGASGGSLPRVASPPQPSCPQVTRMHQGGGSSLEGEVAALFRFMRAARRGRRPGAGASRARGQHPHGRGHPAHEHRDVGGAEVLPQHAGRLARPMTSAATAATTARSASQVAHASGMRASASRSVASSASISASRRSIPAKASHGSSTARRLGARRRRARTSGRTSSPMSASFVGKCRYTVPTPTPARRRRRPSAPPRPARRRRRRPRPRSARGCALGVAAPGPSRVTSG